jgi:hypothetical protein
VVRYGKMKHKVTCMDCGKTERIEVEHGKKIESNWKYFGTININSCQTDKYFYKQKHPEKPFDIDDFEKAPNSCYDPNIKPKFVEMWECGCSPVVQLTVE